MIFRNMYKNLTAVLIAGVLLITVFSGCGKSAGTTEQTEASSYKAVSAESTEKIPESTSAQVSTEETVTVPASSEEAVTEPSTAEQNPEGLNFNAILAKMKTYRSSEETARILAEADAYLYGIGTAEAGGGDVVGTYKKAAENGSPLALLMLSSFVVDSKRDPDPEAYDKMLDDMKTCAYMGTYFLPEEDPERLLVTGLIFSNTPDSASTCIPMFEKVFASEIAYYSQRAAIALGEEYENRNDHGKAAEWFSKAAESGSIQAMDLAARQYLAFLGDYKTALYWFEQAQDNGFDEAGSIIRCYLLSREKTDLDKAYTMLKEGYDSGRTHFAARLGDMYLFGWSVKKDIRKALEYYAEYVTYAEELKQQSTADYYYDSNLDAIHRNLKSLIDSGQLDRKTADEYFGSSFMDE